MIFTSFLVGFREDFSANSRIMYTEHFCNRIHGAWLALRDEHGVKAFIRRRFKCGRRIVDKIANPDYVWTPRFVPINHALDQRRKEVKNIWRVTKEKGGRRYKAFGSAAEIQKELINRGIHTSKSTVRRDLHALGLKPRVRRPTPTRDRVQLAQKKRFCRRHAKRTNPRRVMFTDESWLTCNEFTGRVQWCAKGEKPFPLERKARWNVPSVMIWAAVGVGYKSPIVIFPSTRADADGEPRTFRLSADDYVRRCLSRVAGELSNPLKKWILLHDGARSHVARQTKAYLARKGIEWLDDFPPYCPDLNMIEAVWKELIVRVGAKCPTTLDALVTAIKEAWDELPQRVVDAHCMHWSNVLLQN